MVIVRIPPYSRPLSIHLSIIKINNKSQRYAKDWKLEIF